jgi:hypothetical protein
MGTETAESTATQSRRRPPAGLERSQYPRCFAARCLGSLNCRGTLFILSAFTTGLDALGAREGEEQYG